MEAPSKQQQHSNSPSQRVANEPAPRSLPIGNFQSEILNLPSSSRSDRIQIKSGTGTNQAFLLPMDTPAHPPMPPADSQAFLREFFLRSDDTPVLRKIRAATGTSNLAGHHPAKHAGTTGLIDFTRDPHPDGGADFVMANLPFDIKGWWNGGNRISILLEKSMTNILATEPNSSLKISHAA